MARKFAAIQTAIWDDPEFCALSRAAQGTYFMLVSQRDVTAAGTLPLTLRRWGSTSTAEQPEDLTGWLDELVAAKFVLIDERTEELLVRTFVKWDDGYKHAVRRKAIISSAEAIRSPRLHAAAVTELAKVGIEIAPGPVEQDCDTSPVTLVLDSDSSPTVVPVECDSTATAVAVESQRFPVLTERKNNGTLEPGSLNLEPGNENPSSTEVDGAHSKRLLDAKFAVFWSAYPKKSGKAAARRRFDQAVKGRKVDPDLIIAGAERYRDAVAGVEPQYVKNADGWLNAGRYEDETVVAPRPNGQRRTGDDKVRDGLELVNLLGQQEAAGGNHVEYATPLRSIEGTR